MHRGIATFTLDTGKCPPWLFKRMVKMGRQILEIMLAEYGPDKFIERIADPVWFQSLGTVLAFDWNASGLTTILTAALKEAIRGQEQYFGLFICGGKGKTSLKTPEQIHFWANRLCLSDTKGQKLIYNSKMSAKVDSSLIQDGYQLYHHTFFFSKNGAWAVVQQGMNKESRTARRYHWHSKKITDLIQDPHSGIISQKFHKKDPILNMTAKTSVKNRDLSVELVNSNYSTIMKDIQLIRKYSSPLSHMVSLKVHEDQLTLLELTDTEFSTHPVLLENFSKSKYLDKILWKVCDRKPESYQELLKMTGVGPKTIRALSLVSELIYGAKASYQDPARYSFAHGGKDGTPYPVDRPTYDRNIELLRKAVRKSRLSHTEKNDALKKLN
ncbi:DUF763 domain-containing protein [Patescibacteria group bacterium]